MKPREVFLSHASADRRSVDKIIASLKHHRVPVWYSKTHLKGAEEWHDEIGKALARCDWLVVVLSPSAVKSEWVKREVTFALIEKRYRKRIIPILLKTCRHKKLSWTLSGMQMIDYRKDFKAGLRDLLRVWNIKFKEIKVPAA